MNFRNENKLPPVVRLWTSFVLMLPGTLASCSYVQNDSIATVVLLFVLLFAICTALVFAWKTLIRTEGGESYHPMELWQRAQDVVQDVKNRLIPEDKEEGSTAEDQGYGEEEDAENQDEEEPDITAL